MRLRTFTAPDMPSAMRQVREALGEDAVILSSQTHGKRGVSVTAAVEASDELRVTSDEKKEKQFSSLATHHSPLATESLRFQIQELLRFHNIPELFIAKIMNADRNAWQGELRHCLEALLAAFFRFEPLHFPSPSGRRWREAPDEGDATHSTPNLLHPPHPNPLPEGEGKCIMLIGPPGIGKTMTIARLAAWLAMERRPPLVITTDNKRAGGIEQLQAFTDILDIPLTVAGTPKELRRLLNDARTHVLIDTAGCNPYNREELHELAGFAEAGDIEPVLAMTAGGDSLEAIDAVETFMALPIRRLLVTRADTARRFGGVLTTAASHDLAFCNASSSSSITDPLLAMDESLLAQFLLRYQLKN